MASSIQDDIPLLKIPETQRQLAARAEAIRVELTGFPDFSDTRQINEYGFHGDYLAVLDELPESPRWTVTLTWRPNTRLEQVILVPAIDPRSNELRGYGFPRRFSVSKVFPDGSREVVAEWMEEDCPDPSHVPLKFKIAEPWCDAVRIDVYRGVEEGGLEFFALGEVFGAVQQEVLQAVKVQARPEFWLPPYWGRDYLMDQKTGLGRPLGLADESLDSETNRDFSIFIEPKLPSDYVIDFDLGSERKMDWLTLLSAKSPSGSIVSGYGFPERIRLLIGRKVGNRSIFKPIKGGGWAEENSGDNAIRLPLHGVEGRWLRLRVSNFAKDNRRRFLALGEVSISQEGEVYPIESIRFKGFPEGVALQAGALTDGRVGGRPILHMMEWFELIERQNLLEQRLAEILLIDAAIDLRWSLARKWFIIVLALLVLLVLMVWALHWQFSLQNLRLRIAEEQHHTEIEQMKLRFFTNISHELRTPLTVIPAPIERAMRAVGEGKLRTYLGVALRNVRDLQQLVEQILDLRSIQDGKMCVDPVEMELVAHICSIIDSMQPLAEAEEIDLVFDSSVESFVVCLAPEAIKRILGNLLGNAIKFTPSGGRVVVGLSVASCGIVFSVEDTGSGIAPEDLPNIFEQHYRGQAPFGVQTHGSGIGLALVHELVGLLGGNVYVESPITAGQGSRFTVELPIENRANNE